MKQAGPLLLAAVLGLGTLAPLAAIGTAGAADPSGGPKPPLLRAADPADPPTLDADPVELPRPAAGRTALRLLGDQLDEAAELNDRSATDLRTLLRTDETAWLTTEGRLYYREPRVAGRAAVAPAAAPAYPLDQTFALHSKPGSQRTIFIDVDGAAVSGTEWHRQHPATPTTHPAWDPAGDGPAFSDAELASVQELWVRVAEDYAPFDVNVTTQDPGAAAIRRSGPADEVYGAHALVTPSAAYDAICEGDCGGVAFVDVFDEVSGPGGNGYGLYQPAWVFPQGTGNDPKDVAEALAHEVGHQLGLSHDGNATEDYDRGHGSWAPIMGLGYYRPITQWSRGSYPGADNPEDDVAIIRGVLGERIDEAPSTIGAAPEPPRGTAYISSRTDVDTYRLGTCTGPVTVTATPLSGAGANLDLELRLLDAGGTRLASADPPSSMVSEREASGLGASITRTLATGEYYLAVDGVGNGPWTTGYDDYGSLGAYTVGVTGTCAPEPPAGAPGPPAALSAPTVTRTTVALSWSPPADPGSSAVTGYRLSRSGSDEVVELGADASSYTWTGLASGTSYVLTVAAVNASGTGRRASVAAATTASVPSAPQALRATWQRTAEGVVVQWNAPVSDGGGALVEYQVYAGSVPIGKVSAPADGVVIKGLGPGPYVVGVAAVNLAGSGPLATTPVDVPAPPANDAFAARQVLVGASGSVTGDNSAATGEPDDPTPPSAFTNAGDASLWYSWTAASTGLVTMSTSAAQAGRDTTLAAYTGSSLAGLVRVAGNDDVGAASRLSQIRFPTTAGTTYAVAVDGYPSFASGTGPFTLSWASDVATTTTLTASARGTTVTLTSTVSAPGQTPAGAVRFDDAGRVVGSAPLVAGRAVLTLTGVAPGLRRYRASFVPAGPGQAASASAARPVTVVAPAVATRTTITAPRTARAGARPKVTVRVTRGSGSATGKVVLRYGARRTTLQLRGGRATFRLPKVRKGRLRLTASYAGHATAKASRATATITVKKAPRRR